MFGSHRDMFKYFQVYRKHKTELNFLSVSFIFNPDSRSFNSMLIHADADPELDLNPGLKLMFLFLLRRPFSYCFLSATTPLH
jgi:hypothetical protein